MLTLFYTDWEAPIQQSVSFPSSILTKGRAIPTEDIWPSFYSLEITHRLSKKHKKEFYITVSAFLDTKLNTFWIKGTVSMLAGKCSFLAKMGLPSDKTTSPYAP